MCTKHVGGAATTTVQLLSIGLTLKTEKVLFRQCRHIRTASWGFKVKGSEPRDQQDVNNIWNKTKEHVLHSLCCFSSSVAPWFCQSVHICLFTSVYIFNHLVWVVSLGSLPLVVTPNQVCFKICCSVTAFSRRAGPSHNNAAPPYVQSLSGPCNWSQCSP